MTTALITGASRGLGRALATDMAARGWNLVLDARGDFDLQAAADQIRASSPAVEIRAIPGDVAVASHRADLMTAVRDLGGLDLLVNNASVLGPSPQPALRAYPLDVLAEVYRVNVLGPLGLIQGALPLVVSSGGTIVNVTSDAAVEPYDGWGGYGSSKAALEQVSKVLAAEEPAIRVYSFDPGDMRTQMHQEAFPGEDISDRPWPETVLPALRRLLDERPPSGRYRAADLSAAGFGPVGA